MQEEEEHAAADEEVDNLVGNRSDNDVQWQQANNDDESAAGDEYDSSDDDEMRNHSEPLLSYHKDNQPHNQHNHHRHVGKGNNGTLNKIVDDNDSYCTTSESLPPLPDTMQLVCFLVQEGVQRARRSEQQDHNSEPHIS